MNALVIPQGAHIPAVMQSLLPAVAGQSQDLTAGVGGMPVISIRGRAFRFKKGGQEVIVTDPATGFPLPYLDVIMVKANAHFSKIYYADAYKEGDDNPPSCFSVDGVRPDPTVPQPVCASCAACPNNVWGSKITPQGTRTKACQDNRRIAVVPATDPMNETWGGVALLRVPPASLNDLATFGTQVQQAGMPYQSVVVRMSFDPQSAYPKLVFQFLGVVNDGQAAAVMHWLNHEQTARILSQMEVSAGPAGQPAQPQPNQFQQPQPGPMLTPAVAPVMHAPPPGMPQPMVQPQPMMQPQQPVYHQPQQMVQPQPVYQQPQPMVQPQPMMPPAYPQPQPAMQQPMMPQQPTMPQQPVMQQPVMQQPVAEGQPPVPAAPTTRRGRPRASQPVPPAAAATAPVTIDQQPQQPVVQPQPQQPVVQQPTMPQQPTTPQQPVAQQMPAMQPQPQPQPVAAAPAGQPQPAAQPNGVDTAPMALTDMLNTILHPKA